MYKVVLSRANNTENVSYRLCTILELVISVISLLIGDYVGER